MSKRLQFGAVSYLRCQQCGSTAEAQVSGDGTIKLPRKYAWYSLPYGRGDPCDVLLCTKRCLNAYKKNKVRQGNYDRVCSMGEEFAKAVSGQEVESAEFTCLDYGPRVEITFVGGWTARIMLWQQRPSFIKKDDELTMVLMPQWGPGGWKQIRQDAITERSCLARR